MVTFFRPGIGKEYICLVQAPIRQLILKHFYYIMTDDPHIIETQHGGRFTVFVGGFPIFVDGQCVGGIGASGGNGEQDIACCEAGIAAFMATLGK